MSNIMILNDFSLADIKAIPLLYAILIVLYICFFMAISSFINVLIYRLPKNESIIKDASHCPNCNAKIKWYHNIPIFSYLILRGKCHYCKEKIDIRYLIVELTGTIAAILSLVRFDLSVNAVLVSMVLEIFIAIFYIDKNEMVIPDSLNLTIIIIGIVSIVTGIFLGDLKSIDGRFNISYIDKLVSIVVNLVFLFIFYLISKLLKKPAIGGGDLKFLLGIGLFVGWQLLILGLLVSCIIGAFTEIIFSKKLNRKVLPFGPYLTIGYAITIFFGLDIISWYLKLFI